MSRTYAIGDLHGRYDLMERALYEIEKNEPGRVIFLGDYVDRGPRSADIIYRLMEGPREKGWQWIALKGNHEDMMVQTYEGKWPLENWLINGGGATLLSYAHPDVPTNQEINMNWVPRAHINWMAQLPLMFVDKHRVYVHAGIDETKPLHEQTENTLLWSLYLEDYNPGKYPYHVVHGHVQHEHGPILHSNRTNLDTFAIKTGRLVIGVFDDDKPGGPVDLITVKDRPYDFRRRKYKEI